ncbi:sulfotransferase family protein [Tateyamaria omphalii]|uniref:sulfotransferase family 2 domain-containing protein n=1 Tax=Tateyamaria omphalii TaxID=299262 RepID=UPI001C99C7AB|nr:sulfotransferase family 2 domain-containing protein [Tateyamaria omphalii]MBY5932597.1 sulfotransferase family protein [Tateyamaria omphalii]
MVIRVDSHRLAYMAVPKAACSSVKAALAVLDPLQSQQSAEDLGQKQVHAIYPTMRFRKHRWDYLENHFKFTVVRDPLKRLLAVYTNRVEGLEILTHCRKIRRGRVHLPTEPDPDYFFQNLSAYVATSSDIKHHTLPTALFTGTDWSAFTKVYRTGEMQQLGDALSNHTGRDVAIPHFNSSDRRLDLGDLAPQTQRVLEVLLEDEYAHLAPYYDNPFDRGRVHAVA